MKVVNLDKVVTKNERIIILNGKEHRMHSPTVQDYIEQMKSADELAALAQVEDADIDTARKVLELTIKTLMKSFPTITEEEFRNLSMEQLEALRALSEDASSEEAPQGEDQGELPLP